MKSPKTLFINLPIRQKMQLSMLVIAFVATSIISFMHYRTAYNDYINTSRTSAVSKVQTLASTLKDNFSAFFMNTFRFLGVDDVNAIFASAAHGQEITSKSLADVAKPLDNLMRGNSLIDTILIISSDGAYFSNKNIRLKPENHNIDIWPDHGEGVITWLSARKTPFVVPDKYVIPLSFSLTQKRSLGLVIPSLVGNREDLTLRIVVMFDYRKVINLLQVDDADPLGVTYIADKNLRPLTIVSEAAYYPVATNEAFISALASAEDGDEIQLGAHDTYIVYKRAIGVPNLSLISIINKARLLSGLSAITQGMVVSMCITVLVATALSAILSQITTRPLNKLVEHVRSMERGVENSSPFVTKYDDEIGELGTAIGGMISTIDQHMLKIQEEERKRYNAEIRVLTQQINPHFIYNTLDCIRWEILKGNAEGSANMVEALAKFLRLGFGRESDMASLEEEITRIEQYVHIMRNRLCGTLTFTSYVQQELLGLRIPRMALQPMVENSIKHGFGEALQLDTMAAELHIDARIVDGYVLIGAEDNGLGINIQKAQESLSHEGDDARHKSFGLYNSLLRMRAAFGAECVEIRFSTTPFFVNRVEYRIPCSAVPGINTEDKRGH